MAQEKQNTARVKHSTVNTIASQARMTPSYFILMATSGILAAGAFLSDSVPLLMGAMVVSPVFPLLVLIAFALVSRRYGDAACAMASLPCGLLLVTLCAMLTTRLLDVFNVQPAKAHMFDNQLLKERVSLGWYSVVAAFAEGVSGAIAISRSKTDTLVGVVAALALVPAAVASGVATIYGTKAMVVGRAYFR